MTTGTMSPAELMAGLRDDTTALLAEVKAERAAADKALNAMRAETARVVARQNAYDNRLDEQAQKVAGALTGLDRKITETTKSIDLRVQAERAADRMDETYARGEAMADRHEKILNNIGLVVGYTGQWMLFAAVLVWGVGFLVWSLVRGWSMLVAKPPSTWDRILGFTGWAAFTMAVLAVLFFGGKWLHAKWRE